MSKLRVLVEMELENGQKIRSYSLQTCESQSERGQAIVNACFDVVGEAYHLNVVDFSVIESIIIVD